MYTHLYVSLFSKSNYDRVSLCVCCTHALCANFAMKMSTAIMRPKTGKGKMWEEFSQRRAWQVAPSCMHFFGRTCNTYQLQPADWLKFQLGARQLNNNKFICLKKQITNLIESITLLQCKQFWSIFNY